MANTFGGCKHFEPATESRMYKSGGGCAAEGD